MKLKDLHEGKKETRSFIVKGWDKIGEFAPFDVEVTYTIMHNGVDKVPYGEGSASLNQGYDVEVQSVKTAKTAKLIDENEKVVKTFPKGTDISELPGYKKRMEQYFYELAVDDGVR